MGDYHTTYKRAEGESTQWEDAQRRLGNMAPAEEVWKPEAWAPTAARPAGAALIDGGRDELSDLEGEFDDDRFLEEYRYGAANRGCGWRDWRGLQRRPRRSRARCVPRGDARRHPRPLSLPPPPSA